MLRPLFLETCRPCWSALQGARRGRGPNLHLLEPGNTPEGSVSTGIGTDISLATDDSFPVRPPPRAALAMLLSVPGHACSHTEVGIDRALAALCERCTQPSPVRNTCTEC